MVKIKGHDLFLLRLKQKILIENFLSRWINLASTEQAKENITLAGGLASTEQTKENITLAGGLASTEQAKENIFSVFSL